MTPRKRRQADPLEQAIEATLPPENFISDKDAWLFVEDVQPDETAKSLLSWMDDDPYGFCHNLDRVTLKVLKKKGLEVFVRRTRAWFDLSRKASRIELPGLSCHAKTEWL